MPCFLPVSTLKALMFMLSASAAASIFAAGNPGYSDYRLNTKHASPLLILPHVPATPQPGPPLAVSADRIDSAIAQWLAARPFAKLIAGAARDASLEPALVHAVISVESGYNAAARSPKGAMGLMQVMPATALRYGVNNAARSPAANLRAGTRYLKDLMEMFDQRLDLVLAAYNAGEGAVLRYGQRIPPYRETQQYVPAVLARYREWREPLPAIAGPDVVSAAPRRVRIEYMPGTVLEIDSHRGSGLR